MPLTQDQKNWLLQSKGFDPQKFYVDEDRMEIMPMQSEAPANNEMAGQISAQNAAINADPKTTSSEKLAGAFQKPTESSTIGALGRSARSAALPTLGGLALGGLAAAPFTGGTSLVAPLVASILGGVAGGVGTSLVQEKAKQMIYSKDTLAKEEAQRQLDVQQHPIASKIGEFVPQALAMRPNPKNVYKAGKLLAGGLKGATPEAAGNLANIALGGTLGGLQGIAQPLIQGQPVRGGDVAASVGAGLFLNQPTAIGRLFMPKAPPTNIQPPINPSAQYSEPIGPYPRTVDPSMAQYPMPSAGVIYHEPIGPYRSIEDAIFPSRQGIKLESQPMLPLNMAAAPRPSITAKPPSPLDIGDPGFSNPIDAILARAKEAEGILPYEQSMPKPRVIAAAERKSLAEIAEAAKQAAADRKAAEKAKADALALQEQLKMDQESALAGNLTKDVTQVRDAEGNLRPVEGSQLDPNTLPKAEVPAEVQARMREADLGFKKPTEISAASLQKGKLLDVQKQQEPIKPSVVDVKARTSQEVVGQPAKPDIRYVDEAGEPLYTIKDLRDRDILESPITDAEHLELARMKMPAKRPAQEMPKVLETEAPQAKPLVEPVTRGSIVEPASSTKSTPETSLLAGSTPLKMAKDIEVTGRTRSLEEGATKIPAKESLSRKPLEIYFEDAPKDVQEAHNGLKIKMASPESASLNIEPLITVGKHLYKKYQDFAKWADELRYIYGEGVGQYLRRIWSSITGSEKPLSEPALKGESAEMPKGNPSKIASSPAKTVPDEFQSLPGFRSMVDEMATHGKTGTYAAERFKGFLHTMRQNIGKYVNEPAKLIIESKLNKASRDRVNRYAWEQRYGEPHTITLSPKEQKLLEDLRKYNLSVHSDQRSKGILVSGVREAMDDPNYWQGITSNEVGNILDKKPNSPEATKLKKDWVDHVVKQSGGKVSAVEAQKKLQKYLEAKASDNWSSGEYNAVREAEGYGVPWSWQEKDLNVLFDKYGKRVSRDFAYFDEIQQHPEMRKILNRPDQTGDYKMNPEKFSDGEAIGTLPRDLLEETNRWIGGKFSKGAVLHEAVNNFARSGMIGVLTATKNVIGNIGNRLPYIAVRDWTNIGKGLLNLRKGFEAAARQGVIRRDMNEIYNQIRMHDTITDMVNKQANRLSALQLTQSAEKFDRAWMMSDGMLNAMSDLGRIYANKGKITPGSFVDQFKYKTGIEDYLGKHPGEVPPEIIEKIAANYVERVQGTYDPRGVPRFAMKGNSNISPYFSLARWGMENFNNFQKDIVAPAIKRGDYAPLLKKIFGTFLSGTALSYVVKEISNKKDFLPKLDEAMKSEDPKAVTLAIINTMKLGSFGGIASDILAAGTAIATHRTPMGVTWPAMNMAESVTKRISQASQAIGEGENALAVLTKMVAKMATDNVQTARIVANHTWKKDEAEKSNYKRDLQFWEYLSGTSSAGSSGIPQEANPFINPELRDWREAKTPEEISASAGPLARRIRGEIAENPLNAKRVISRLRYQPQFPMPNPETDAPRAKAYYDHIKKTQGEEAAQKMVGKWRQQKDANKMKSQLIGN